MTKKDIYIAGKISGEDRAKCTMKFGAAQMKLEKQGYNVVNPLALVNDWRIGWAEAMRICIAELVISCDAIYLLSDWQQSRGAVLEATIARALGLEIINTENTEANN